MTDSDIVECEPHDWEYEVEEFWYVNVYRECVECGAKQQYSYGLSSKDFVNYE